MSRMIMSGVSNCCVMHCVMQMPKKRHYQASVEHQMIFMQPRYPGSDCFSLACTSRVKWVFTILDRKLIIGVVELSPDFDGPTLVLADGPLEFSGKYPAKSSAQVLLVL